MIKIPKETLDRSKAVIEWMEEWLSKISRHDLLGAFDMTITNSENPLTPVVLEGLIRGYGSLDTRDEQLWITDPSKKELHTGLHRRSVAWFADRELARLNPVGSAVYFVPLNYEWSDVQAVFDIMDLEDGWGLELVQFGVL